MIIGLQTRPVLLLLLILLANLLLLSIQARDEQGKILLKSWSVALRTPFGESLHFVRSSLKHFTSQYILLVKTERENQRLMRENELLKLETRRLQSMVETTTRSGGLNRISQRHQLETISAFILQKSPPFLSTVFQLNVGFADAVQRNSAVIRPEGIVGRVQVVTQWGCEVQPITQPGAGAGALLEDSRTPGVIRGQGNNMLRLDYIPISVPVRIGELVQTSGTDQLYPPGLPIGRVTSVTEKDLTHKHILVQPAADILRLEEVFIIKPLSNSPPDMKTGENYRSDQREITFE